MFRVARFPPRSICSITRTGFRNLSSLSHPRNPAVPSKTEPGSYSHDHALFYDPFEYRGKERFEKYQTFYRKNWHDLHGKVLLPYPWSCDWSRWEDGPLIALGSADVQDTVSRNFGVTAPMSPMAFISVGPGQIEPLFLFAAGGEYYYWRSQRLDGLRRFKERFSTHEDFLRRFEDHIDHGEEMVDKYPDPE